MPPATNRKRPRSQSRSTSRDAPLRRSGRTSSGGAADAAAGPAEKLANGTHAKVASRPQSASPAAAPDTERKVTRSQANGKADASEGVEGTHTVRKSKIDAAHDFDPGRNKWTKVLSRASREMGKLKKELHILATFAAADSKGGPKAVRQTHEGERCIEAIQRTKQALREILKQCEAADGDPEIAAEQFDSDGGIDNELIRCSACADETADDANDILLCDGDLCNRAYHVSCLPVKASFDVESLPEDVGWLCPACDCRYDILWDLAETFDLDYESLTTARWHDVLAEDATLPEEAAALEGAGAPTILDARLASDDESDDGDFAESASDGDASADDRAAGPGRRSDGAGPSRDAPQEAEEEEKSEAGQDGGGSDGGGGGASGSGSSSSSGDDEDYVSDSDSDGEGLQKLLQLLEEDAHADPETFIVQGKRTRTAVDYRALNDEMFGDVECYDGEGVDEDFTQARAAPRPRKNGKR